MLGGIDRSHQSEPEFLEALGFNTGKEFVDVTVALFERTAMS
jgi:hypothetical protein